VDVERGPRGVSIDPATNHAYVTNEDAGTVSVIDLGNLAAAPATITLDANARPAGILVIPSLGVALITEPSAGPNGRVLILNLAAGTFVTVNVNPDRSGGSSDLAYFGNTAYFANQSGGSITVAPISVSGGNITFTSTTFKVDLGARALAVDSLDQLLVVSSEGSGSLVVVDLSTTQIAGRINTVRSEHEAEGVDVDNHNDHERAAANATTVSGISPSSATAGTTFTLTVNGTNLTGAAGVQFSSMSGMGNGHGMGGGHGNDITVSNIQVNAGGTQLTCTVQIAATAPKGARVVSVETLNGESMKMPSSANTFTVN
jgi:YVTN family beta-propeller protein